MNNFFLQILKKINKLDDYTTQYLKASNNIEIPALAYTNWGMHLARTKDFKSAIDKLETAVLMSNQNPKPCISLGIIYAKLKEYDKAETALKLAIKRDSQNAYVYSILSSVQTAVENFEESEINIKKALKLEPKDSEIYLNYGILLIKQKKKLKAIEMLKKAKLYNSLNPNIYFLLGVMLFETNNIPDAFNEFKSLEALEPIYKNLNYYLALCYKKENNNLAVIEYAEKALEENPENPLIYIMLAQSYFNIDKNDNGFKILEQGSLKGICDCELYLFWAVALLKINKVAEAKDKLYKALDLKKDNDKIIYRLGECFLKENNLEEAEKLFKEAIEKNSENHLAIADLGKLYYNKNEYEKALKLFFNAIDISSKNTYLYFYIGNIYYKLEKLKKSIDYYEKTIEYHPNHIEAYINYTICLMDIGNIKEALRKIRTAYQLNRNSEKILYLYAIIDLKAGIYTDAIEKADLLLNISPLNKNAKLIKTQALININKPQEALNILYSIKEEEKNTPVYYYLCYCAYKILVDDNPSDYNKKMLELYLKNYEEINQDKNINPINTYISETLSINKG